MTRQSERPESPLVAPNLRFGSPSAPVDGKAISTGKSLHIAGFLGRLTTAACRRGLHPADAEVTTREPSGLADTTAVGGPDCPRRNGANSNVSLMSRWSPTLTRQMPQNGVDGDRRVGRRSGGVASPPNSKATHPKREAPFPIEEIPYPYLHSRHNHRPNPCFQPVSGGCEADFVRDGFAVYTRVLAGVSELRNRRPLGLGRPAPPERRTLVRGRSRLRREYLAGLGRLGRCSSPLPARLPRPATGSGPRRPVRSCASRQLGLLEEAPVDLLATGTVT